MTDCPHGNSRVHIFVKGRCIKCSEKQLIWQKVYKGPFDRDLGEKLAKDLKRVSQPAVNVIYDARAVRRSGPADNYDVEILTEKL